MMEEVVVVVVVVAVVKVMAKMFHCILFVSINKKKMEIVEISIESCLPCEILLVDF